MLRTGYTRSILAEIASRDLRNDTAGVLRRVAAGEEVVVTVRGKPSARMVPLDEPPQRRWMSRAVLARVIGTAQADPGLRHDLERLAGETTDDLEPLE